MYPLVVTEGQVEDIVEARALERESTILQGNWSADVDDGVSTCRPLVDRGAIGHPVDGDVDSLAEDAGGPPVRVVVDLTTTLHLSMSLK